VHREADSELAGFEAARRITQGERDRQMALDNPDWPNVHTPIPIPEGWTRSLKSGPCHLFRLLEPPSALRTDEDGHLITIRESMLRFPSAPIRKLQRLNRYQYNLRQTEGDRFHSLRIYTDHANHGQQVQQLFIFHNGLNETFDVSLYHQLSAAIIRQARREKRITACILRPFPGHLSRYPFDGFSDTPLDRYLADGSNLFRQFMRFMLETQWLLSAIVPIRKYYCTSGAPLLAQNDQLRRSRLDEQFLSKSITNVWCDLYRASHEDDPKKNQFLPGVRSAVHELRSVLGWSRAPAFSTKLDRSLAVPEPAINLLGYSLGGYAAQSVFMTWPFAIESCTTLLAGGALRLLAPTAFAHPEEWQTVLHSLRYELDYLLMGSGSKDRGLRGTDRMLPEDAGIERKLFQYLMRIFYEVFSQEYRGSYQSRVSEFATRLLFIVGGKDPIVRAESVLEAAPAEGVNMVEIARLGHLLASRTDKEEQAQRDQWIPEIAGLAVRFGHNAARAHWNEFESSWLNDQLQFSVTPPTKHKLEPFVRLLTQRERSALGPDGSLPMPIFGRYLNDLVARVSERNASLFILKNEIPSFLLPEIAVQRRAQALFHDDYRMFKYYVENRERSEALLASSRHVVVLLPRPEAAKQIWMTSDSSDGMPSQSESAVGYLPLEFDKLCVWEEIAAIIARWNESRQEPPIRSFVPDDAFEGCKWLLENEDVGRVLRDLRTWLKNSPQYARGIWVNSLPDAWILVDQDLLVDARGDSPAFERFLQLMKDLRDREPSPAFVDLIRTERVRIITESRARFNPRHRGQLVIDTDVAARVFRHAALALAFSVRWQ